MALAASSKVDSKGIASTPRRGMSFGTLGPFFALAVGLTWGIAALFPFPMNGPAWPDAQPWDTLVFAIAAVVVVLLNRKAMLTREGAVAEVLLSGDEGSSDAQVDRASRIPLGRVPDRMEV